MSLLKLTNQGHLTTMGHPTLPLPVTYIVGVQEVPAKVVRLLKNYFEVEVAAYTNDQGTKIPAQTRQLDYNGEPKGSKQRTTKTYQARYGVKSPPSIDSEGLSKVRVMSGRTPH